MTGAVGSEDVLKLTLEGASSVAVDGTGNVTVKAELLGNLLHQDDPNAGSLVVSGITVVGADDDGDSLTANVSVTVNDDAPILTSGRVCRSTEQRCWLCLFWILGLELGAPINRR